MQNQENNKKVIIHHAQMMIEILKIIGAVDFQNITGKMKVPIKEYKIVAVKQLLTAVKSRGWSIGCINEKYYGYNGASWREYKPDDIKWLLVNAAEKMGIPPMLACDADFVENMIEQFLVDGILLSSDDESNENVCINLKNGTYEVSQNTRGLKHFDSKDNLFYQLSFHYDADAQAPKFQKYLDDVLPDMECQKLLAEYIGYSFTRTSVLKLEKVLLLYGSGANGKSVFFDVINALLGWQNCTSYTLTSLTDDKGYSRAKIANKLVNYCSEISTKMDVETFKILSSGEPTEARLPYEHPLIIRNYAKLIFNCNSLPREVEVTNAFFRRLLIIPFTQTIPEEKQDKELATKIIAEELPGVLNWVLLGLERILTQRKFSQCKASKNAVAQYNKDSDSLQVFLEDAGYEKSDTEYVKQNELYDRYKKYCGKVGLHALGIIKFGQRCDALRFKRVSKAFGKAVYLKQDPLRLQEMLNMIAFEK